MGSEPAEGKTAPPKGKLARLQSELESTKERLRQEQLEHRQLQTRQLELMQSVESLLTVLEVQRTQKAEPAGKVGWLSLMKTLLTSLSGGILGGGLVLAMGPWLSSQRSMAKLDQQSAEAQPGVSGVGGSQPIQAQQGESLGRAAQTPETVQFRCAEPCWLDIRTADSGKRVFYKLLKGTANFAVGTGLDVFSGRADLLKVRINEGEEQPFLPGQVVGSRVIRPSTAPETSP
jgi:hypothetical protein